MIDPETWLREQDERVERILAQAEHAKAEMATAEVTLTSRDQTVTVRVNPAGVLLDLQVSPRAERLSTTQLTAKIMETYRKACSRAAKNTIGIMSGLVGDDSEAMDFLRSTVPQVEEDDDEDEAPGDAPRGGFGGDPEGDSGFGGFGSDPGFGRNA